MRLTTLQDKETGMAEDVPKLSLEDEKKLVEQTDNSVRPEDGDQGEADNTPGEMASS